jgi:hypothetical protein
LPVFCRSPPVPIFGHVTDEVTLRQVLLPVLRFQAIIIISQLLRTHSFIYHYHYIILTSGPGSSVGIATDYGLHGPGIESWWGEIFRTCPDRPWGPPSLFYNGCRVFPGGRKRPGRDAVPSPLLVPRSKNGIGLYLYSP